MKGLRVRYVNYQDALETALGLAGRPSELDEFLTSAPAWRSDLERALALSSTAGRELRGISPAPSAAGRRERELIELVSRLQVENQAARSRWAALLGSVARPRLLAASAGIAAVLLALALATSLPPFSGGSPPTAEAVLIEGSVAEIGGGIVTITTADSAQLVRLSSDTVLTDGFGNTVGASALSAGQTVVLKGSRSEDGVVASQVELRDRLFGVVTAMPGDSIHLRSSQGEHVILVSSQTKIEGPVAVGAYLEVKIARLPDGRLSALEIEVEDSEGDDSDNDGPSSTPATAASPVPSTSPSPGAAEPEDHELADDDHTDEPETKEAEPETHEEEHEEDD